MYSVCINSAIFNVRRYQMKRETKYKVSQHCIRQYRSRVKYDAKVRDIVELLKNPVAIKVVSDNVIRIVTKNGQFVVKNNIVVTAY